jgi:hypothetical protein
MHIKDDNYNNLSGLLDEISRMLTGLAKSKIHEK